MARNIQGLVLAFSFSFVAGCGSGATNPPPQENQGNNPPPTRPAVDEPECTNNSHCADGVFCNGVETCANGVCRAGDDPCDVACSESANECVAAAPPGDWCAAGWSPAVNDSTKCCPDTALYFASNGGCYPSEPEPEPTPEPSGNIFSFLSVEETALFEQYVARWVDDIDTAVSLDLAAELSDLTSRGFGGGSMALSAKCAAERTKVEYKREATWVALEDTYYVLRAEFLPLSVDEAEEVDFFNCHEYPDRTFQIASEAGQSPPITCVIALPCS